MSCVFIILGGLCIGYGVSVYPDAKIVTTLMIQVGFLLSVCGGYIWGNND
jgi:hypothetical protein